MSKKVIAVIYLKSGQTIRFPADKVGTSKSAMTGDLLEVRWENAINAPLYIDLEQVAAVTTEEA